MGRSMPESVIKRSLGHMHLLLIELIGDFQLSQKNTMLLSGHHHCGSRRRADRPQYASWRCTAPACLPGERPFFRWFPDQGHASCPPCVGDNRRGGSQVLATERYGRSPFARMCAAIDVQDFTGGERGVGQKQRCIDDFFHLTDP